MSSDLEMASQGTRSGGDGCVDRNGEFPVDMMSLSELKSHVETRLKSGVKFSHIAAGLHVHRNTLRRYLMKDSSWGGVYDKSSLPDVCHQLREVVPLKEDGSCWGIRKCQAALRASNLRVSRRKVRAALYSLDSHALQLRRLKRSKDSTSPSPPPICEDASNGLDASKRSKDLPLVAGELHSLVPSGPHMAQERRHSICTSFSGQARQMQEDRLASGTLCRSALSDNNDLMSAIEDGQSGMGSVVNSTATTDPPPQHQPPFLPSARDSLAFGNNFLGSDVATRGVKQGHPNRLHHSCMEQADNQLYSHDGIPVRSSAVCGYTEAVGGRGSRYAHVCMTGQLRSPPQRNQEEVEAMEAASQNTNRLELESSPCGPSKGGVGVGVAERKRWFPYMDEFKLNQEEGFLTSKAILEKLDSFLVAGRRKKIECVVKNRTYTICIVLESLLDPSNIATVCQSADAFGFQSVHLISNGSKGRCKKQRKSTEGVEKWLDVEMWDNTRDCLTALRSRGYRIAVTHDAADSMSVYDLDWTVPTAVILGNESRGPSHEAILSSDIRCNIPMVGMEDALSLSVVAGILMQHAVQSRLRQNGIHGDLLQKEQQILAAEFCMRHSR